MACAGREPAPESFPSGHGPGTAGYAYLAHIASLYPHAPAVAVICVAHLVPTAYDFLPAVDRMARLAAVIPKRSSADPSARAFAERLYEVRDVDTEPGSTPWAVDL